MKPLAPRLRHRVTLQRRVTARDAFGGVTDTWKTVAEHIPAEIVPLSGREFIAAHATQAGVTARITIRWRNDVTAAMRILHDGAAYNIKAVLPDPTLRRHISLMCEQGVNDG